MAHPGSGPQAGGWLAFQRSIATRHDKSATIYLAALHVADVLIRSLAEAKETA